MASVVQFLYLVIFLFQLTSLNQVRELILSTTYEAEDAGLTPSTHPQCRAWNVYWSSQSRQKDLSIDDIELLAIRRRSVTIYNMRDAARFFIPEKLIREYDAIYINFESICRLYPRILWLNSTSDAARYRINTTEFCENLEGNSNATDVGIEADFDNITETTDRDWKKYVVNILKYDSESDVNNTVHYLYVNNASVSDEVQLSISPTVFKYHQTIAVDLHEVCSGKVASTLKFDDEEFFNSLAFDVTNLGMTATQVKEYMKDEGGLDDIMQNFHKVSEDRPFPATQVIPFLKKVRYDQRTAPSLMPGHIVKVKIGIFLQSVSNFELSTMDYDMDVWLRMAWRDIRLAHGLSKPILINEYTSLRRIWRPDPFFANAKDAKFHRVTFLNFYMFVFPNGEVFMEMRTMLKNSCQLVFCKYPHDNQKCGVRISSLGFTQDMVKFEWFSRREDAIGMKGNLQLPELFLMDYTATTCNGQRKSAIIIRIDEVGTIFGLCTVGVGNYTCVEANIMMKRDIGYHVAQTYIPTTICVVFSWVGAWLPEEFVEGRILVSLTVFLTLSAENNAAKEDLPKVSYIKAIDLWFGFTSTFVFATMIQALIIISLENQSNKLKKKAEENEESYGKYVLAKMLLKSRRYHRIARDFDTFCKVMYPVIFLLFLMIYGFVITEGEETKCLRSDQA